MIATEQHDAEYIAALRPPRPMAGMQATERRARRSSKVVSEVKKRDRDLCVCCFSSERIEVHHIHPLTYGGEDSINNCVCVCKKCHDQAPDDPKEFLEYQRMGGHLPWDLLYTFRRIKAESGPDAAPLYATASEKLEAALLAKDVATITSFSSHYLRSRWYKAPGDWSWYKDVVYRKASFDARAFRSVYSHALNIAEWSRAINPSLPELPAIKKSAEFLSKNSEDAFKFLQQWSAAAARVEASYPPPPGGSFPIYPLIYRYCEQLAEALYEVALAQTTRRQPQLASDHMAAACLLAQREAG